MAGNERYLIYMVKSNSNSKKITNQIPVRSSRKGKITSWGESGIAHLS